jgi:MraZ protein
MNNFVGNPDAKVDMKGRVFVPAEFRKILQGVEDPRLILRKDIYEDCLVLYPAPVWEAELAVLRGKLKKYGRESRQMYRKFIAASQVLEMDSNGRILIPKRYLQLAGITTDVRFIGIDNTIEIWSPSKLDKPEVDEASFEEFMNGLDSDE